MKSLPRNFKLKKVAGALTPNVDILSELIGSTETDFLYIGEKLQDFHQRASHVAKMTTDVGRRLAGEEMDAIIKNFKVVLEIAENLHGGFAAEKETLKMIMTNFSQISSPLLAFEKIVRNLNILCNFIKIEIARLGRSDTEFNTLADDVRHLASVAGAKTTELIDKADALMPLLAENLSWVENLGSRNEEQARMILQKIVKDIGLVNEKTNISTQAMKDVAEKWENISANMAQVVESMQFHDITRQRFEHAREALSELPQKIYQIRKERSGWQRLYLLLKSKSHNSDGNSKSKVFETDVIADTCELETDQLQHAGDGFVAAVLRIVDNLINIARQAGSMSTKIHDITGGDNDRKGSFVSELSQDIGYLETCINECLQLNKDLSVAMLKVAQTASGMSVFMKDMEKISIEMQMLALNARVHAAHIGDQGVTLGVLADSIHQLATETTTQVGFISMNLKDVVGNAEHLATKANEEYLMVQDKAGKIKDNLEQIVEPIKKIEEELQLLLPRMDEAGKILADDIEQLTSGVTIHQRVDKSIKNVVVSLINISEKVRPDKTVSASPDRESHLDDLAKRYTMHTERETHLKTAKPAQADDRALMNDPISNPAAEVLPDKKADDDLGDNVELF